MAVPTITSIDPNTGLTRGDNIIKISGTNFRLPPPPPSTGYLGGDQQKTVSVKFEGQESAWAYSASATMILARVPEYRGPHDIAYPVSLDVRVANLDDSGLEIPGENVTEVDGYDVDRPSLAVESYFQRVIRALQHVFKRHVHPHVYVTVSRDAPSSALDDQRLVADAPALYLTGPRTPINRFDSINREEGEIDPGDPTQYYRRRYPVTVDMDFVLEIVAKSSRQLYGLIQSTHLLFRDVTEVRVTDDPGDDPVNPTGTYKEYEILMPWEFPVDVNNTPNPSDLFTASAGVRIRGVHIDEEAGNIIERGWIVDATSTEVQPMTIGG